MSGFSPGHAVEKTYDMVTFRVDGGAYGIHILNIQEINKLLDLTPAPGAPPYVRGILNLRGQIVTIIDLGLKLGLSDPIHLNMQTRNIIVRSGGESIGLLVERIGDVVRVASDEVDAPPANMNGLHGKFFDGVVKTVDELIGILNVEKILE